MAFNRNSKFPIPRNEAFYYDEVEDIYKPLVDRDGMMPVQSIQKKWKDSFSFSDTLSSDKWNIVTNKGATISIVNGELSIDLGLTVDNEVIIETKEMFTDPFRALLSYMFTGTPTGQEWHFEAVAVDRRTGEVSGEGAVGWRFKLRDDHATYNYYASYYSQSGNVPALYSAPTSLGSSLLWTTYNLAELELFADEVWYHQRLMDSSNGRAVSFVRHQQLPDPNAYYKIRLRGKNAVAQTIPNQMKSQFLTVVDYAELTAEITSGRGNISAGQGMAVTATGGSLSSVSTVSTAYVAPKTVFYTESTSAVTTTTPFASTARDCGSTNLYSTYRVRINSSHSGTLEVLNGSSSTNTSNKSSGSWTVQAGVPLLVEVPIIARYIGIRFTNTGGATTTSFEALSALMGS